MKLNERYRKFPIKFYQTEDGIYYENPFMNGKAKDMTDAFNQIKDKNLDHDLYYYYNDVTDIQVGAFEPALYDKKTKNGVYLGKLNLELELNDYEDEHSVKYLSKNPDKITDHEKFIKKLKDTEKRKQFFADLKSGFKKLAGVLQHEMFSPYKTREDLICDYCGEIIPTATYYEEWKKKNYHLECIWDKLCNNNKSNSHEKAEEYFLSLEKLLDNWDYSMDCPDDYESDLELYKVNKRLGLTENAAMYYDKKSETVKDFVEKVLKNPQECKNAKFRLKQWNLCIPADTILHDIEHDEMTPDMWELMSNNFNHIFIAGKASKVNTYGKDVYHVGLKAVDKYFAVTIAFTPNDNYICTCFCTTRKGVEAYVLEKGKRQKNHSIGLTSQPSAPATKTIKDLQGSSVATYGNSSNNIIQYIEEKIKG